MVDTLEQPRVPHVAARAWAWVDTRSPAVGAALVAVPLAVIYLLTANSTGVQANDAIATALPAHRLVTAGDLWMDAYADDAPWLREGAGGHLVSNRFPGTIFLAVPFTWLHHLVAGPEFSFFAGAITAALVTAMAMAVLYLVLRRVTSPARATAATAIAALATPTWGISADILWTHGPTQLWLALGLLGVATERFARSGLAFGMAVFTRPPTAVIAAVTGIGESLRRRALRPLVRVGVMSALGLLALVAYNAVVHGDPDPVGGYNPDHLDRVVTMTVPRYLANVAGTLVSPARGVLVHSPFLIVLAIGLRRAWREAPAWTRTVAVAGVAYLLFHLRVNRFSGGFDFLTYRLPLEMLTVAAPLLVVAYVAWVRERRWRLVAFWTAVAASFSLQWLVAASLPLDVNANPWTFGELAVTIDHAHPLWLALLIAIPLVTAAVGVRTTRHPRGAA